MKTFKQKATHFGLLLILFFLLSTLARLSLENYRNIQQQEQDKQQVEASMKQKYTQLDLRYSVNSASK